MRRKYFVSYFKRTSLKRESFARLTHHHVFILPTRAGLLFALTLAVILIGSINYNNNLGYMLTFLLASLALVSILHTHRMLLGLQVTPGKVKPVFVGDSAQFQLWIDNREQIARYAVHLQQYSAPASLWKIMHSTDSPSLLLDIPSNQRLSVTVTVLASQRGRLALGRILVMTTFPLGLFRAWAYIDLDMTTLVYPQPIGNRLLPGGPIGDKSGQISLQSSGNDDFTGYRDYRPGDSPRHIDWKAVAREQGLLVKQFGGTSHTTAWLTWDSVSHFGHVERGLSQLCLWILIAEEHGIRYGLDIPGSIFEPAAGEIHRKQCLQALALFENTLP